MTNVFIPYREVLVLSLAFSPDGRGLAAGTSAGQVEFSTWERASALASRSPDSTTGQAVRPGLSSSRFQPVR